MTADLVPVAAQYGLAGFMVLILGWLLYRIGLRMVKAIDTSATESHTALKELGQEWRAASKAIVDALNDHTKTDVSYHNEVNEALVRLETRFDTALELTPVRPIEAARERVETPARGVPTTKYLQARQRGRDDGDR